MTKRLLNVSSIWLNNAAVDFGYYRSFIWKCGAKCLNWDIKWMRLDFDVFKYLQMNARTNERTTEQIEHTSESTHTWRAIWLNSHLLFAFCSSNSLENRHLMVYFRFVGTKICANLVNVLLLMVVLFFFFILIYRCWICAPQDRKLSLADRRIEKGWWQIHFDYIVHIQEFRNWIRTGQRIRRGDFGWPQSKERHHIGRQPTDPEARRWTSIHHCSWIHWERHGCHHDRWRGCLHTQIRRRRINSTQYSICDTNVAFQYKVDNHHTSRYVIKKYTLNITTTTTHSFGNGIELIYYLNCIFKIFFSFFFL